MLKPLADRVLVRPSKQDGRSTGGILLPDIAQKRPQEGEVFAVGPGKVLDNGTRVSPSVKVGDTVVYSKYAGTEVKVGEEDLLLLEESAILAIRD
jgi:chaperonin GroES